jgi:hypothetical protein
LDTTTRLYFIVNQYFLKASAYVLKNFDAL